ncbi:glycosyltransferase [uncultured Algibacter sp.]|uniref:glycosyltransferase family 2 protein n=1 Tax=uncultured Algibacter sp. TaxID=298659 RepID=UPI003217CFFF
MLSILIPTYNYDTFSLAQSIHEQAIKANITFEILVYDDASSNWISNNDKINNLEHAKFKLLKQNIGRSAIRNLLANDAKYTWLLFLDADTKIINENFIQVYLNEIKNTSNQIVYGGICYQKDKPNNNQMLRWVYGNKREALSLSNRNKNPYLRFLTLNFLAKKDVFDTIKFNVDIPNLRHEDTLFALDAKKNNINIKHIDNPVLHLGLELSETFLKKSEQALDTLHLFVKQKLIEPQDTALSKYAKSLIKFKLHYLLTVVYWIFKTPIKKHLLKNNPSLILFDFYRLGYYLNLSK